MGDQRRIRLDSTKHQTKLDEIKNREGISKDTHALRFLIDLYDKYEAMRFRSRLVPK